MASVPKPEVEPDTSPVATPAVVPEVEPTAAKAEAAQPLVEEAVPEGPRNIPVHELVDEPVLCGTRGDVDLSSLSTRPELRYPLEATVLSALIEAYLVGQKWQVPTHIDLPHGSLVVDTTQNLAYLDFDQSLWSDLLARPLPKRLKTRAVSRQEFLDMSERWKGRVTVVRLDRLLWRAGLETSVGRLPAGVNPGKTVFLKHWPNLTRLHQTPHAIRIAALWATRGASLLETAALLKVAQRHVFAFYNAAVALDLVTDDGAHVRRAQRKATKNKGLLGRLFGWLQK